MTPDESNGLIAAIRNNVDDLVSEQKNRILTEFSLDNRDSALSRLVSELRAHHGRVTDDLKESIHTVVNEFSLDKDDSALSRLVKRVEDAQRKISDEFTLDEEGSALSRMRRDLSDLIENMRRESLEFQQRVISSLEAMRARREESFASTRHGKDFEDNVYGLIANACQKAGDVPEHVGNRTGEIRHCRVGDCLITLGPDCNAAGARIVCEAKEDASYDLRRSLDEIATARANRKAEVGLFVHSSRTARPGLSPLARYGNDIVVVWNAEDEQTDPYLVAALIICKALAVRQTLTDHEVAADFDLLERSIREVERQAGYLDEIKTSSSTIKSGAERILNRVETMRSALLREIESLDTQAGLLRRAVG